MKAVRPGQAVFHGDELLLVKACPPAGIVCVDAHAQNPRLLQERDLRPAPPFPRIDREGPADDPLALCIKEGNNHFMVDCGEERIRSWLAPPPAEPLSSSLAKIAYAARVADSVAALRERLCRIPVWEKHPHAYALFTGEHSRLTTVRPGIPGAIYMDMVRRDPVARCREALRGSAPGGGGGGFAPPAGGGTPRVLVLTEFSRDWEGFETSDYDRCKVQITWDCLILDDPGPEDFGLALTYRYRSVIVWTPNVPDVGSLRLQMELFRLKHCDDSHLLKFWREVVVRDRTVPPRVVVKTLGLSPVEKLVGRQTQQPLVDIFSHLETAWRAEAGEARHVGEARHEASARHSVLRSLADWLPPREPTAPPVVKDACSICCDEVTIEAADNAVCPHRFHWKCIFDSLRHKSECPTCRHKLKVSDLRNPNGKEPLTAMGEKLRQGAR
jgi:hypothetical protein